MRLDEELLPIGRREVVARGARQEIGGAARREGIHDTHRLGRPGLRRGGRGDDQTNDDPCERCGATAVHSAGSDAGMAQS